MTYVDTSPARIVVDAGVSMVRDWHGAWHDDAWDDDPPLARARGKSRRCSVTSASSLYRPRRRRGSAVTFDETSTRGDRRRRASVATHDKSSAGASPRSWKSNFLQELIELKVDELRVEEPGRLQPRTDDGPTPRSKPQATAIIPFSNVAVTQTTQGDAHVGTQRDRQGHSSVPRPAVAETPHSPPPRRKKSPMKRTALQRVQQASKRRSPRQSAVKRLHTASGSSASPFDRSFDKWRRGKSSSRGKSLPPGFNTGAPPSEEAQRVAAARQLYASASRARVRYSSIPSPPQREKLAPRRSSPPPRTRPRTAIPYRQQPPPALPKSPVKPPMLSPRAQKRQRMWGEVGISLVSSWIPVHGLPQVVLRCQELLAAVPLAVRSLLTMPCSQPAGMADSMWHSLSPLGQRWLTRLHRVRIVPDSLAATDAADIWLSSAMMLQATEQASMLLLEQGLGGSDEQTLVLSTMILGRFGVGAENGREVQLLGSIVVQDVAGVPDMFRSALRALDGSIMPHTEWLNEVEILFPAAWRTASPPRRSSPAAAGTVPVSSMLLKRLGSERELHPPGMQPPPPEDPLVGVTVEAREDDPVWQELVAETELWLQFERVDEIGPD
jgi:hypothetical protein